MESEQRIEESIRELAERRGRIVAAIAAANVSLHEIDGAIAALEARKIALEKVRDDGKA